LYDTLWEEAGEPRLEEKKEEETEPTGAEAAGGRVRVEGG
jgi:hypothetical protein